MAWAHNGAIRLFWEAFGDPAAPAVLLLNGAGRQSIDFADEFCAMLVARCYHVVRFDQRDTGLSTEFGNTPPDASGVAAAVAAGETPVLAYTIADIAADALAVLEAAGLARAHLFGRSLGSLAAQLIALEQPQRVVSLTLAMAFSRAIGTGLAPERLAALDAEVFPDAASYVARQVASAKALGNPAYFDEARIVADATRAYARGVHRGATARHFMVGLAAPDLRERLGGLNLPVQVIHGRLDKVIPASMAEETAAAIPGARLALLDDMAHEAPPQLWERWVELFVGNAARAI